MAFGFGIECLCIRREISSSFSLLAETQNISFKSTILRSRSRSLLTSEIELSLLSCFSFITSLSGQGYDENRGNHGLSKLIDIMLPCICWKATAVWMDCTRT